MRGWVATLIIVVTTLLALAPLWQGEFYAVGDMRDVYIPIESFFHEQQLEGNLPAWMPDAAWGFPVIASAQIGYFYPPLLLLRFLPVSWYLPLVLVAHFIFLALGVYLLSRSLGSSRPGSILAAVSFAFGGFVTLHLTHLNIILALAWLPWQFYAGKVLAYKGLSWPRLVTLSLLFGMPFLAGQLQIPFLMALVSAGWFLYLRWRNGAGLGKSTLFILAVAYGAIMLTAVQLLPTLELLTESSRKDASTFDIERANQHSYPLYHLPTTVFPRFYDNDDNYWGRRLQIEYGFYVGTIPLVLAVFALASYRSKVAEVREKLRSSEMKFLLFMLVVSFLLALGSWSPFRLFGFEPSLWFFSAPARWLLFSSLALSLLAGKGYDLLLVGLSHSPRSVFGGAENSRVSAKVLLEYMKRQNKLLGSVLFLAALIVLVGNVGLFVLDDLILQFFEGKVSAAHWEKIYSLFVSARSSSFSLLSIYTYLPLASLSVWWLFLRNKHLGKILLGVATAELLVLFLTTTPTLGWDKILGAPQSVDLLQQGVREREARIYSIRRGGDTGAYFTDPESRAGARIREKQRQLLVPLTHSVHGVAGVEWPASMDLYEPSLILEKIKKDDSYEIDNYELARELNIGAVLSFADKELRVDNFDCMPRVELRGDRWQGMVDYPDDNNPGRLDFDVDVDEDAKLIVRDTNYPGWKAYVDGKESEIDGYMKIFRSVSVPAGKHRVSFVYEPKYIYIGLLSSLIFVCFSLFVLLKSRVRL